MKEMLKDYSFVQTHRRYLANRAHIAEWDTNSDTILVHGEALPFARRIRKEMARGGAA